MTDAQLETWKDGSEAYHMRNFLLLIMTLAATTVIRRSLDRNFIMFRAARNTPEIDVSRPLAHFGK
jgi:hypothetical protein